MSSALFSPYKLAGLELANRIVVSPMCQYSGDDGCANDWHLMHLGMLANSGAALVVVEATHVERHGRITHGCLGLYSDDNEAALARVIAQVRRAGTAKFGIQIAHSGRKGSAQKPWDGGGALEPDADPWPTLAASPIPFGEGWHTPREVTEADMERVRAAFVTAAQRSLRIGFDEIELHMAHGYLAHGFMSPTSTTRTRLPYFSPNRASAPIARASSIDVWNARTSRSLTRTWLTSSSASLSTDGGTAPIAVKSNRNLPGEFSEPACAADSPSAPRNARCTRWVAVCEREIARRRSMSISAYAAAPTTTSPEVTRPRCTISPGTGVCTSRTSISPPSPAPLPAVLIRPVSASWPPPSA